jgi:hypothetical protein
VRCGPSVDAAEVTEEIAHVPARAGRDVGVETSATRGSSQPLPLFTQDGDVLGNLHARRLSCPADKLSCECSWPHRWCAGSAW